MTAPHLPFELTRGREVRDLRDRAVRTEGRLADVSGLAYGMREPGREEAS
jgi:hypothetical protein